MVEFADDHIGLAFAIGAGRPVTVVTVQWSLDPPYFTSEAPMGSQATDACFLYAGENTPYPGSSVIAFDDGVAALSYFLKTGELDPNVAWERL